MFPVFCMALAVVALVGACARPGTHDVVGAPRGPGVIDSAGEWDTFPVDRVPRPIIVSGGMVGWAAAAGGAATGFRTGDAKLAFLAGRIELATTAPEAPATVDAYLFDGRFTLPALPPADAFASLRGQGSADASLAPVRFTTVTLGSAAFDTDRGPLRLPAWLFGGPDVNGTVAWPAVGKEAFWRYGEPNNAATLPPTHVSPDGRRIRTAVPGRGCRSDPVMRYRVEVTETATTVLLTTVGETVSTPGPEERDQPCVAIARAGEPYDVYLAAPLGNRVVIESPEVLSDR
ncbi:hypothetical protein Afe04nite_39690 [Asanoa ferruginea]|nr:hypothetical protein Afe04nite_39690 [Asanoa ferruginea]